MKVVPFGDRLLVKRRTVGEKLGKEGLIHAPDTTRDRPTDLADVVYVPELTLVDTVMINNAETIIKALTEKANQGDAKAFEMLMKFNDFLNKRAIKVGDTIMISKYVGTDFHQKGSSDLLTLVNGEDIIGWVVKEDYKL